MIYMCELCDYETDRAYDLKVHNLTKKHLKKSGLIEYEKHKNQKNINDKNIDKSLDSLISVDQEETKIIVPVISKNKEETQIEKKPNKKIYVCKFCNKTFNHCQGRWSHEKICKCKNLPNNTKQMSEIAELKQTVEELTNIIKSNIKTPIQTPININMTTNNTNSNNNNSINTMNMLSAIKYINQNYLNTQPLQMLEPTNAKTLLLKQASDNHSVEEFMVYYYDKCLFDKFIGEIIKDEYIQKNPEDQQFWTTDVSRLSFVVRRVMQENESKWIKEPEGKMLKKYIISPILMEVKNMIDEYNIYCKEKIYAQRKTLKLLEMEKLGDATMTCKKISSDIGNQLFDEPVLKYIAPYFKLEL